MNSFRFKILNKGVAYYLFNKGAQWALLRDNGTPNGLNMVTGEPVLLAFALDDGLVMAQSDGGKQMIAAVTAFCDSSVVTLMNGVVKAPPVIERSKELHSLESAGINVSSLTVAEKKTRKSA